MVQLLSVTHLLQRGQTLLVDAQVLGLAGAQLLRSALDKAGLAIRTDIDLLDEVWPQRPALPERAVYEHRAPQAASSRIERLAHRKVAQRVEVRLEPESVDPDHDLLEGLGIDEVDAPVAGRVAVAAKGAKRPHSQMRPVLLPFQRVLVQFGRARGGDDEAAGHELGRAPLGRGQPDDPDALRRIAKHGDLAQRLEPARPREQGRPGLVGTHVVGQ